MFVLFMWVALAALVVSALAGAIFVFAVALFTFFGFAIGMVVQSERDAQPLPPATARDLRKARHDARPDIDPALRRSK